MQNFSDKKPSYLKHIPALIALILFACSYYIFMPGFFSPDSVSYYKQTLGLEGFSTDRPILMPYMWKIGNYLVGAPNGLHFSNLLFYWLATYMISTSLTRNIVKQVICTVLIGCFPPIFINVLHLWRDTCALVFLMMAIAMTLYLVSSLRKKPQCVKAFSVAKSMCIVYAVLALVFITCAWCVRLNSRYSVFSLVLLVAYLMNTFFLKQATSIKKIMVYCLTFISVMSLHYYINHHKVKEIKAFHTVYLWDLAGISLIENKQLLPKAVLKPELREKTDQEILEKIKGAYSPITNSIIWHGPLISNNKGEISDNDSEYLIYWLKTIIRYPLGYIKVRLAVAHNLFLGNGSRFIDNWVPPGDTFGLAYAHPNLIAKSGQVFNLIPNIFFNSYMYMLISCILLYFSIFKNQYCRFGPIDRSLIIGILCSGLLYVLRSIISASACDFRYNIWLLSATLIGAALFFKCFRET